MAADEPERVGTVVVRVWAQGGDRFLRARIVSRRDLFADEEVSVAVVGAAEASSIVADWLNAFEQAVTGR